MAVLRSLAFALAFYGFSLVWVPAMALATRVSPRAVFPWAAGWARAFGWLTRHVLGVQLHIEGTLPEGRFLYAIKHEAAFEAVLTLAWFRRPAVVMKAELRAIPVWGWLAAQHGSIFVDREGSAGMLRAMARQGAAAVAAGRPVVIFPEGTRVPVGTAPPLAAGFAGLYRLLGLPVVPIALDSGSAWPKGLLKRPGVVTMRVGEILPPGLPRAEIEARTHAAINALNGPHRC
ncbi:hypothetical protein IP88_14910 [alpha proteobacterium AAP81b]|nr:hypothetical protein IP88_14910 [alpha proteobacterium AAP81b]